ncbi:MAG TPA: TDT family transporter [Acidimicrobiales bacterium]|nr:TDT family transporter [Acidimicrobiales bacterium]
MNEGHAGLGVLAVTDAEGPKERYLGPNWYASVMGTGIVANAGASLPFDVPGLRVFCELVWLVAAGMLVSLLVATARHWLRSPTLARSYHHDVQMSHFYGAPPMAFMTVGAGAILAAHSLLGLRVAVDLDWVLWTLGTVGGLITVVLIPFRLFTEMRVRPDAAFGGWLMPVVPPMVSASTGALLIAHVASFQGRATLLYICYALFGMSFFAALIIITLIWSRLAHFGSSNGARVPTLWIVLGPLGQSITAVGLLGSQAHVAVGAPLAAAMGVLSILFGVPVWGFAMLWVALAAALTVRTVRRRMPFSLTWWSFTFPVGVTVTGTIQLAAHTGLPAFRWASAGGYVALLCAWLLVFVRTWHATNHGILLRPPAPGSTSPVASKGAYAPARAGV